MSEELNPIRQEISEQQKSILELERRIKAIPEVKIITKMDSDLEKRVRSLESSLLSKKNRQEQKATAPYNTDGINHTQIKNNEELRINEEFLILGDWNKRNILTERFV